MIPDLKGFFHCHWWQYQVVLLVYALFIEENFLYVPNECASICLLVIHHHPVIHDLPKGINVACITTIPWSMTYPKGYTLHASISVKSHLTQPFYTLPTENLIWHLRWMAVCNFLLAIEYCRHSCQFTFTGKHPSSTHTKTQHKTEPEVYLSSIAWC